MDISELRVQALSYAAMGCSTPIDADELVARAHVIERYITSGATPAATENEPFKAVKVSVCRADGE